MEQETMALLSWWCEKHCGKPMAEMQPVHLDGWAVVHALWPLNDDFRPQFAAMRVLPYDAAFESKADRAIERYLADGRWGPVSIETWRVLLERHMQAIMVATLNAGAGNPVMPVPQQLPDHARQGAAMLFLLHAMKLPFPPGDRSDDELPTSPPLDAQS